ncbi:MAG: autotransporter domain-containing protein [Elusimicrobiota bacterium]
MLKPALTLLGVFLLAALRSHAATFTVTDPTDAGVNTLRGSITNAAVDPTAADTIGFTIGAQTLSPGSAYDSVIKNGGSLTITAPATTILNNPGAAVFNFSGTGIFTLTGLQTNGIITLGDGTILAGATCLDGGTIQTGNYTVVTSALSLTTNGGTVTGGGSVTLSGQITGAGALNLSGGNYVTLTNTNNNYSGGTFLSGSTTLVLASDASLGNAGGVLSINGSSLQTNAALSSARALIVNGASSINTNGFDSTFSGSSSGGGSLTKYGAGTLTLSGANGYSGFTEVTQGTLNLAGSLAGAATVDFGATMTGGGIVGGDLTNNGTVKPNGTLTVNGNYNGGGATLSIDTSVNGKLAVGGAANIAGATVNVANRPAKGVYTVISSVGGVTGTLAGTTSQTGVIVTPIYLANALELDIVSATVFGTTPHLTRNQGGVASAFDAISLSGIPGMDAAVAKLNALAPADLAKSLDQMAPSGVDAAVGGMSFAASGAQSGAIAQRVASLRAGAQTPYAVNQSQPYPGILLASAPGDTEHYPDPAGTTPSRWGLFVSGLGSFGRLDARTDAGGSTPGFTFTTGGASLGADYRFTDNFIGGVTLGDSNNSSTLDGGAGSVRGRAARYGVYGTLYNEEWHGSLYLGGATDEFEATRNMTALGLSAASSPHAQEFNADASVGLDEKWDALVVSPFADIAYDRVMTGAYAESGAGALDLNVSRFVVQSQRSTVGAQVFYLMKLVTPYVSVAESHEFENQGRAILARYGTGGQFVTQTADVARDGAALGAGLRAQFGPDWSAKLGYLADLRPGFYAHTFNGELRLKF